MSKLIRITIAVVLVGVAAFCIFGLLASYEPGIGPAVLFRVLYSIVGLASLGMAGWLVWPK